MRQRRIIYIAVGLALFLIPRLSLFPSIAKAQGIRIGVLLPLNGKLAIVGDLERKAFEMAAKEVNVSGGIQGQEIELYFRDSMGDPYVAKEAVTKLLSEDGVVLVTGGCSSSATLEATLVSEESGIPFLICTASADRLTEMNMEHVFRLNLPVSEYGKSLLLFLSKIRGLRNAAILRENSRYGQYESKTLVRICRRRGLLLSDIIEFSPNSIGHMAYLDRLSRAHPDVLFVVAKGSQSKEILGFLSSLETKPHLIICKGDPFLDMETDIRAQAMEQDYYTTALWHPAAPYPGAAEFSVRFYETYGIRPDYHSAQAYAALQVIKDTLVRSLDYEPESIRESLEQTDMMTIYGPVKFLSYGHKKRQNRPPVLILRWSKGELNPVNY